DGATRYAAFECHRGSSVQSGTSLSDSVQPDLPGPDRASRHHLSRAASADCRRATMERRAGAIGYESSRRTRTGRPSESRAACWTFVRCGGAATRFEPCHEGFEALSVLREPAAEWEHGRLVAKDRRPHPRAST